jgi:hypothetical protein
MVFKVPFALASRLVTSCVLTAALLLTAACDKDESGGDSGNPIRPGSRLTWTQGASSVTQLRALTFRVYVDNVANSLGDTQCSETFSNGGYECSGRLPSMSNGRHVLELASLLAGVESERSSPLSITIGTAATTELLGLSPADDSSGDSNESAATVCVSDSAPQTCYDQRLVTAGLRDGSSLTSLPDGRLLFVEGGTRIRVVIDRTLVSDAALALDGSGTIVGLAADSGFAGSRSVFIAWTSASRNGVDLNVTRYRELQNTLGEGATIVTGLPFREGLLAPLAVDSDGLLYLALPASPRAPSGAIMRFTRDGLTPRANTGSSPTIAEGFANPADLAIDARTSRVWISGDDPSKAYSVATLGTVEQLMQRSTPTPVLEAKAASDAPALTVLSPVANASTTPILLAVDGQLMRGEFSASVAIQNLRRLQMEPDLPVLSVAEGPGGAWYVLTGTADGPQSILLLAPR